MSDGAVRARTVVVEVEAFEMTEERRSDEGEWPDWLVEAFESNRLWPLWVESVGGSVPVRVNDWIINTAGELSVCTPAEFEAGYEAVGEAVTPCCGQCGCLDVLVEPEAMRVGAGRIWCFDCREQQPAGEMIATTTLSEREET